MKISTAQEAINGNSNDTVITPLRLKQVLKSKNIDEGGSSGGITTETDPIFKASPAAKITDEDIENWNSGTGGGEVIEETDPTVPDYVKAITQEDIDRWNSGTGGGTVDVSEKLSKVLYDNSDGTNTTVQLTETYNNFKYLEVFCNSSDNTYAYTRIDNPVDGKRATVIGGWFGTYSYFKNCVLVLSGGDKINVTQGNASEITGDDNCNSVSMANAMKVVKVVGYYDENVLIVGNNTIDGIPIGSKFEYDGEEVPDGYEEVIEDETEDDTGWQKATLTSYFKPYNNNEEYTPVYRKVGKLVEIRGTVSPNAAQSAGWTATMFVIPEGFRPSGAVSVLCQGSGQNKWQLLINPTGEVVMDRYSGTSNVAIPATAWLIFQAMFFVD